MGTKRVGWARIKSLINENQNQLGLRNRRIITVTGARTLTASESGATVMWTKGTAHTITLPTAAAGLNFKVVIKVGSDNLHKIKTASTSECFFGQVTVLDNADDKLATQSVVHATAVATPNSYDHIKLDGNANDTGSGVGSVLELEAIDGVAWRVTARLLTSGTPTSIATIYAG